MCPKPKQEAFFITKKSPGIILSSKISGREYDRQQQSIKKADSFSGKCVALHTFYSIYGPAEGKPTLPNADFLMKKRQLCICELLRF